MQFSEFIEHNKFCPICHKAVGLKLISSREYKVKIHNDSYVFSTTLKALGKNQSNLNVDLYLNQDNTFHVDFFTKSTPYASGIIPASYMYRFKEFINNQKILSLNRGCFNCYQYRYTSSPITLNFQSGKINSLNLEEEAICHYKKIDDRNTRVFKIEYSYSRDMSLLTLKDILTDNLEKMFPYSGIHLEYKDKIRCPFKVDAFINTDKCNLDKLETLITFS